MAMKKRGLTDQKRLMVARYFENGFNKQEAMGWVGFRSFKNQWVFKRPEVVAEIKRIRDQMEEKMELNREWIVERLMRIADSGLALSKFKKVNTDGSLFWDFTGATEEELVAIHAIQTEIFTHGRGSKSRKVRKFKPEMSEPKAALDSLARIMGMFNDNVTMKGEVSLIERLNAGRDRVAKEKARAKEKEEE